jgi:hypothetical protein
VDLRLEQPLLAAADLGQDLVDQLLLGAEVVEEHPRARAECLRERPQAQAGEPSLEDVVGGLREDSRAAVWVDGPRH